MAGNVRLILAFHNHQPVGNFDGVFEQSYQESYLPFLNVLQEYPDVPFSLHTSGSLLEWLQTAHPEYIDRVRSLVAQNQIEIMGGAFYEPILANIPRRDRIGQIRMYTEHLESLFKTTVRGMWVPERVWEPSFAGDITAAGIRYTILDDHHFRAGGKKQEELFGYYVTEDEGRLLSVFPGSERLRYLIPFQDPYQTVEYLREIANTYEDAVVVFGDDGEKFGTWPETYKHVYEDRWLERFLTALRENDSWIKVTTPSETLDHVAPQGSFYLPNASYREMTEWALPSESQAELHRLTHQERHDDPDWEKLKQYSSGGFWRNFRVKYSESNEMYARAMEVSARIAQLEVRNDLNSDQTELLEDARRCLYRSQCNCSFWHGAFGGLYLPHLRNAVYSNLIEADGILEQITRTEDQWVDVLVGDLNLDARQEVRLSNHRMVAMFSPAVGGHMYELDLRTCKSNLLATLNRRHEAYHEKIFAHAQNMRDAAARGEQLHDNVSSIHDLVRFKQPDLDKKIAYDKWERKSLVDHFMQPGLSFEDFHKGNGIVGNFARSTYEASIRRGDSEIALEMRGRGDVGQQIEIRKSVTISKARPNELVIQYQLFDLPAGDTIHFGMEFNFATMPGGASDRYYYDSTGVQLGTLDSLQQLDDVERIGLVDEWQGLDVSLEISQNATLWAFPIETISQSESGFELVHQSVAVVPHWEFVVPENGSWSVDLRLVLDTSLARARQLGELGEARRNQQPAEHEDAVV